MYIVLLLVYVLCLLKIVSNNNVTFVCIVIGCVFTFDEMIFVEPWVSLVFFVGRYDDYTTPGKHPDSENSA